MVPCGDVANNFCGEIIKLVKTDDNLITIQMTHTLFLWNHQMLDVSMTTEIEGCSKTITYKHHIIILTFTVV